MGCELFKEENINMKVQGRKREDVKLRKPNKSGLAKVKIARRGRKGKKLSGHITSGIACWNNVYFSTERAIKWFYKESDMRELAS